MADPLPSWDDLQLTPREADIVTAWRRGIPVDLYAETEGEPIQGDSWPVDRWLRGEALSRVIRGAECVGLRRGGVLRLRGARIVGPIDLSFAKVAMAIELKDCFLGDYLDAHGAEFDALDISGSCVAGLKLDVCRIAADLRLSDGFVSRLSSSLGRLHVEGDLDCSGSQFRGVVAEALNADGIVVDGSILLCDVAAAGEVRFPGATVGGHVDCSRSRFRNLAGDALNGDAAVIRGGLYIQAADVVGEARFIGTHVGLQLDFAESSFRSTTTEDCLTLDRTNVGGDVFLSDCHSEGTVRLPGLAAAGTLSFDGTNFGGTLDLRNATVAQLGDVGTRWPRRGSLRLDGLTYDRLTTPSDDDCTNRLTWIRTQPRYMAQPYYQLATAFRRAGYEDRATEVLVQRETDRRRLLAKSMTPWSRARSLLIGAAIAHGYRPIRAFGLLFALWLAWAALFSSHSAKAAMEATKRTASSRPVASRCTIDYPCFNPVIFAAETVVPLVKFGQTENWAPSGDWTVYRAATWVGTALGWTITTIGAAGLTGVLRRKE